MKDAERQMNRIAWESGTVANDEEELQRRIDEETWKRVIISLVLYFNIEYKRCYP
jgi:hypothetical protein